MKNLTSMKGTSYVVRVLVKMRIIKNSMPLTISHLQPAYSYFIKLKTAKYKDVMELAWKYVAQNDMRFYEGLQPDNAPDELEVSKRKYYDD